MQRTAANILEVKLEDLNDDDKKGCWIEMEEDALGDMFEDLANLNGSDDPEAEVIDDRFNFKTHGPDYFEAKFPGLGDDFVYDILAREHADLVKQSKEVENPEDYQ